MTRQRDERAAVAQDPDTAPAAAAAEEEAPVPPQDPAPRPDAYAAYLASRGSGAHIWDNEEAAEYIRSLRSGGEPS